MKSEAPAYDVAMVGAGPVGLLLAGLLGAQGVKVLLVERRKEPIVHSMAIGITPPSLQILAKLGLQEEFVGQGVKVRDCCVHGESGHLGTVTFRDIPALHRFVLSLPQSQTIAILQHKLAQFPNVTVRAGCGADNVSQNDEECYVALADGTFATASYVVACDGGRSPLRETWKFKNRKHSYGVHFVMGDFHDRTDLKDDAHLFFKADGSVESFPLPGGMRRWIVQTPVRLDFAPVGIISEVVKWRTGFVLPKEDQVNQSAFSPRRLNCHRYHDRRLILCGDAAHVMSPIGGQGMNTGFADAEFLADVLHTSLKSPSQAEPLLDAYDRFRRKAAQTAINRAGLGMWLGTWTGKWSSKLRDFIIRRVLCNGPLERFMGSYYAMLTIPYNTLERVPLDAFKSQTA